MKLAAPVDHDGEELAMQQLREQLAGIPGAQYEFARPSLLTLATPVEVILAGYDLERLSARGQLRSRSHGALRCLPRHSFEHRRRPSRDPDHLRPGTRLATRPRGARHRRPRGVERARQCRDALPPAGKENRRAGAQRRYTRRLDRRSAQSGGEPGLGTSGAAVRGRRSASGHRTGGNPSRQPGTRRGDFRGAGGRRPGRRDARSAGHPRRHDAARGHPRHRVRARARR